MSMQRGSLAFPEPHPLADQPNQLHGLPGVFLGDGFEQRDLVGDEHHINRLGSFANNGQLQIVLKDTSGQDDALVGFGRAHGGPHD